MKIKTFSLKHENFPINFVLHVIIWSHISESIINRIQRMIQFNVRNKHSHNVYIHMYGMINDLYRKVYFFFKIIFLLD